MCPAEGCFAGICRKQDYRGWIAYQKRKWRAKAVQRKKRKLDASNRRAVEETEPQLPAGAPSPLLVEALFRAV